jgi:hypothetical protein
LGRAEDLQSGCQSEPIAVASKHLDPSLHEALAFIGRQLLLASFGLADELDLPKGIGEDESAPGGPAEHGASLLAVALLRRIREPVAGPGVLPRDVLVGLNFRSSLDFS